MGCVGEARLLELQLTGLRLARRKQKGGPALRAFMFMITMTTMMMLFWDLHTCSTRARWILVLWPPGLEGRLAHLKDSASGASGERGTERGLDDSHAVIATIRPIQIGQAAKTLTDDCSALY